MEADKIIEQWRDIRGYEGLYQVSNFGRVKSVRRDIIRVLSKNAQGYYKVNLAVKGKQHTFTVHRLVYETFVGPIPDGMQVNHIDENKLNNFVWNLNLMTPKENTNWGTCIERRAKANGLTRKGTELYETNPNAKPILQYTLNGEFIREWACGRYAIEALGLDQASLSMCLHGKTNSCGGFKWCFV